MRPEECFLGEKYVLKRQIGQGGMGKVYLAVDRKLHRKWAVKELNDVGKTVESELMVLKKADHRSLPRIVDILQKGSKTYIVMDYIEGESLKDRISRTGGLTVNEVIRCGRELADVLRYLHNLDPPIIYRDMKPSNIILRRDNSVALVDFGTAKPYAGSCEDTTALGTKDFASPEQFEGRSDVRSDIYALGRTLAECMPETSGTKTFQRGRNAALRRILGKCTQQNPARRYQTASALYRDLDKLEKRQEGGWKSGAAAVAAMLFLLAAVILRTGGQEKGMQESAGREVFAGNEALPETGSSPETEPSFEAEEESPEYRRQVTELLDHNDISWDHLESVLARFSAYNQNLTIRKERIENAIFMAEIYLSYENHLEESLKKAAVILRKDEAVWNREEDEAYMEDREECLLMLSTIFRMLGKKEAENRELYYRTSINYTQEFLKTDRVREEKTLYSKKVADIASMLEEIGDPEEARRYYRQWERDYPGENAEIYLSHMENLIAAGAGKGELEQLMKEAEKIEGMKENEQFKRMEKKIDAVYGNGLSDDALYGADGTGKGEFRDSEEPER